MENKGYIHVYTGNGKGKTTADLGLPFEFCVPEEASSSDNS